jgi:tetratricopeptide (TPR) repeat protein/tRNA A-37 threonylcarbamoyl transferase component Bud32
MPSLPLPNIGDLPPSEALLLDQRCSGFEAAWKAWWGRPRPVLEDHLTDVGGPTAAVLLSELLHLELGYRRLHGETPVLADYLSRFPDQATVVRAVFNSAGGTNGSAALRTPALDSRCESVLDRFEAAWAAGSRPDIAAFLPGTAERLPLLLELVHVDLERRLKSGEAVRVEEYPQRFPELLSQREALLALLETECRLRQRLVQAAALGPEEAAQTPPADPCSDGVATHKQSEEELARAARASLALGATPLVPGYEVFEQLGQGGMGVVYKARHLALQRVVALKMVREAAHASRDELTRFQTEAEAMARLQHPNIAQIFEVGEHQGLPFFSLEFCGGGSLDKKLAGEPQPARQAAELLRTLALAMDHAHQQGVVHRDLKPHNVLLTEDGTAKITDFGLARKLDDDSTRTQFGVVMGTPSYMAPEQARGETAAVGPRADVYALGAVLYELLTGRPPFKGASAQATLDLVRHQEPVPPSRLQPKLPRDLETICLKCLHKEAGRRYAGARELADDLGRFLAGEPIRAKAVGAVERLGKWVRRRPAAAALLVVAVLALVASGAGGVFYGLYQAAAARNLAREAAALQQQQERRERVDALWDLGRREEAAGPAADLHKAEKYFASALALLDDDPDAPADLRRRVEESHALVVGRLEDRAARERFLALLATEFDPRRAEILRHEISVTPGERPADRTFIIQEAPAALALLGLRTGVEPARALEPRGRHFASARELERVVAKCAQVLLAWAEAEAAPEAGKAVPDTAHLRQALRLLDLAAALGEAHHLPEAQAFHRRRARVLGLLGDRAGERAELAKAAQIKPATALDLFLTALDKVKDNPAEAALDCEKVLLLEPDHFWARYLQGVCHLRTKQWADAREALSFCLERDPTFSWARSLRGLAYGRLGDDAHARADFDEVLPQTTHDPVARALAFTNRGVISTLRGQWDDAVTDLRQAVGLQPDVPEYHVNLAVAHAGRKDWDAAVKEVDAALARRKDPAFYHTRAGFDLRRGDLPAARADFQKAIELQPAGRKSERLANDHCELAHLRHLAGEGDLKAGKRAVARDSFQAALDSCSAALAEVPGYPPAYRQRAETLVALDNPAEAGRDLDRYLLATGMAAPDLDKIYLARGIIHAQLGESSRAVAAYTRALALHLEARTLVYRGWAYLQLDAARPALDDFEAALELLAAAAPGALTRDDLRELNVVRSDALCGRGYAWVRLGRVPEGVADAEKALGLPEKPSRDLLFSAVRVYARALAQPERAGGLPFLPATASRYVERALELLRTTLEAVQGGAAERKAFWRNNVVKERDLEPLRRTAGFRGLADTYGQ